MDDEIDIEEHDVLDNPRIKNIFPDLTIIKTEAPDVEEEDETNVYEEYLEPEYDDWNDDEEPVTQTESDYTFSSKIIIGNKPNSKPIESEYGPKEYLDTYVLLEDWGQLLINNPCFCCDCKTLFATQNALDAHKMVAHSFLVETSVNKAVKSTAKSHNMARKSTVCVQDTDSSSDPKFCNHCNRYFSDGTELIKHLYNVLTKTLKCYQCDATFENEADLSIHKLSHINKDYHKCPICSCYFKKTKNFQIHMKNNHGRINIDLTKVCFNTNCVFCQIAYPLKTYNTHIQKFHLNAFLKTEKLAERYKCTECNVVLPNYNMARHHRDSKHPELKSFRILTKEMNKTPFSIQNYKLSRRKMINDAPVPKSTLFKCDECQTHFVMCSPASQHINRCTKTKGEWRCVKCRRYFKLKDQKMHESQHRCTEKFKIHPITDDLYSKVLCKCCICGIYFDERKFWAHFESGCENNTDFWHCSDCDIPIDISASARHRAKHKKGFNRNDFITIEFFSEKQTNLKRKRPEVDYKLPFSVRDRNVILYCVVCKCYTRSMTHRGLHLNQKCKSYGRTVCKECGLTVSYKTMASHKKYHLKGKISIKDYTFLGLQDLKPICPPAPEYNKCKKCNIRSASAKWLTSHCCDTESFKMCDICNNKFTIPTFKLHHPFHLIGNSEVPKKKMKGAIPELLERYESIEEMWHLLYLCSICDVVTDSYDKAIDHCQKHFNKLENYGVTIKNCKICDLKFDSVCFDRHTKLHNGELAINRDVFNILKYNYLDLFKDTWMNVFNNSPRVQVDQIISKSIYKYTRCVKMALLSDGPSEFTIYRCNVCLNAIEGTLVFDHVKTSCKSDTKFTCSICQVSFATIKCRDSHMKVHETVGYSRFVLFNDENDKEFNNVLISHYYSDVVKTTYKINNLKGVVAKKVYYKCTDCDVCIKHKQNINRHTCNSSKVFLCPHCDHRFTSSRRQAHLLSHKTMKFTKKHVKTVPFLRTKGIDHKQRMNNSVKLYKCKCGLHYTSLRSVETHADICSPNNDISKENCSKCGLLFATDVLVSHLCNHHTNGDKKIEVIDYFTTIKLFRCCTCDLLFCDGNAKHFEHCNPEKDSTSRIYKGVKCIRCGLEFNSGQIGLHRRNHKDCSKWQLNIDYKIVYVNTKDKELKLNNKLYKCSDCVAYYFSLEAMRYHFICNHKMRFPAVPCTICGLSFTERSMAKHVYNHHEKLNLKLEDFDIEIVDYDFWLASSGKTKTVTHKHATLPENVNRKKDKVELFKCHSCDVNYLTIKALKYHFDCNHKMVLASLKCQFCGLIFSKYSMTKHLNMHHKHDNLTVNDFDVQIINENHWDDTKKVNDVSINESDGVDTDMVDTSKIETEVAKDNEVRVEKSFAEDEIDKILYKCTKCYMFFVNKADHLCGEGSQCSVCSKLFNKDSLSDHMLIHTTKEYGKDDFIIKMVVPKVTLSNKVISTSNPAYLSNNLYKCHICSVHFLILSSLQKHVAYHTKTKIVVCDECELTFTKYSLSRHVFFQHERLNLKRCDLNIIQSEDKDTPIKKEARVQEPRKREARDVRVPQISPIVVPKLEDIRLFKCKQCNVYFTSKNTCYKHVLKHQTLDSKDYIECKFCGLQFKLNSLSIHMTKHHENEFNLEKVIVEEFDANDNGPPAVEVYQAIDRLQSRVVTTTTDIKTEQIVVKSEPIDMEVDELNCGYCNEAFTSTTALKFHESLEHIDALKTCLICNNQFNDSILKMHLEVDKEFCKCCLCGEKIVLDSLSEHVKVHDP